jgi:hypothetical protein
MDRWLVYVPTTGESLSPLVLLCGPLEGCSVVNHGLTR